MTGDILAGLIVTAGLTGLGAIAERPMAGRAPADRVAAVFYLVSGWSLLAGLGAVVALFSVRLPPVLLIALAAGLPGLALVLWPASRDRPGMGFFLLAILLVAPLLWFAAHIPATIFDEFVQWLPNGRTPFERGAFASAANPNIWSGKPDYPPALPMVIVAASWLTGGFDETIGKFLVVMLGAGFGLVLAELMAVRLGVYLAIPLGVAVATLLNPFFDPRVALTSYGDTPTGFVAALTIYAIWRALSGDGGLWTVRAAFGAVLLVLMRETNVVLVAGLCLSVVALGVVRWERGPVIRACLVGFPAAASVLLWRVYLHLAAIVPSMWVRPVADWNWRAPAYVLHALILDRLAGNPMLGLAAFGLIVAVILGIVRYPRRHDSSLNSLIILSGGVAATWLCFLAFAYIAVFQPVEVSNAASVWRYAGQLGPTLLMLAAATFSAGRQTASPAGWRPATAASLLLILAELATWRHWRVDCRYPDVEAVHRIARVLAADGRIGDRQIFVLNGPEAAWYAVELDYDLHRPANRSSGFSDENAIPVGALVLDLRALDRATVAATAQSPAVALAAREPGGLAPVLSVPPQAVGGACHLF
jgi:hypothetical protein